MNTAIAVEKISHPYNLELTEDERCRLLIAIGAFTGLCNGKPGEKWFDLSKKVATLGRRLPMTVTASVTSGPVPSIGPGKTAAAAILSPPQPLLADHWAKKKPDSWDTIEIPISKVEEKQSANGPYLRVTWPNQGRGFAYGSVFDEALFPFIKAREHQRTTLYTVKNGKYINIIGVRA